MYTVSYLFLKRRPLSWSQTTYGIFVGIYKFITAAALLTLVPLMKNKFRMHDSLIIILAIISTSLGELFFGLSTKSWMVFCVSCLFCLGLSFNNSVEKKWIEMIVYITLYNFHLFHFSTFSGNFIWCQDNMHEVIYFNPCWSHGIG